MDKGIYFLILLWSSAACAHEQWLLSKDDILKMSYQSLPVVFTQAGWFNISMFLAALMASLFWIFFLHPGQSTLTNAQIKWSAFILRLTSGLMLLLLSQGLLPKSNISYFVETTLFAPDLILAPSWQWLGWIEFILAVSLILGLFTRLIASLLILLLCFSFILFGNPLLQYCGFYLGIFVFLIREGGGKFSFSITHGFSSKQAIFSNWILQFFTGLNFIYSGISVKFFHPNLDIALLLRHNAFTFGLPADYFTFLMFLVEVFIGIIIMTGIRLNYIAVLLIILFTFLSINLSENILSHLFIYGILIVFFITRGAPLLPRIPFTSFRNLAPWFY